MPSQPVKVLLVDDSEANLRFITAAISSSRYSVTCARSGKEALRLLLQEEFSIILLDVRMPEMDGFETADLIRVSERTEDIPIIFLTGYDADYGDIRRGFHLGGIDFLQKPFNVEVLKAKIEVLGELHRKKQELRRQEKQGVSKSDPPELKTRATPAR